MSYIVPQVLINQLISEVSLNTIKKQNVLIIGPNYQLLRPGMAAEKASTYIGVYDGSHVVDETGKDVADPENFDASLVAEELGLENGVTGVIEYPNLVGNSVPDAGYTKLFADEVVVQLAELDGFTKLDDRSAGADYDGRVQFNEPVAGNGRDKEKFPRDIAPGDVVRIDYTGSDGKPAVFQSIITSVFALNKDSSDLDCVQFEDTLPQEIKDEMVGDSNDQYPGTVNVCAMFSDVEIPQKTETRNDWNWTTYQDPEEDVYGIVIDSGMKVRYSNWGEPKEFNILSAKLYVQYRTLLLATTNDISTMDSHTHVESMLGQVDPDNPLAFGVYMAALNSGDRLVYYCGVKTDDLSGYNEVLGKASLTDEVYIICPMTMDGEVIDAVKGHVKEMSTAENKLWRIGFVCQEAPKIDMIYDKTSNPTSDDFYGKFLADNKGQYTLMQFMWDDDEEDTRPNTAVKCNSQVEPGDVLKVYTGDSDDDWDDTPHYTEYYVKKVVSNTVIQLTKPVPVSKPNQASTKAVAVAPLDPSLHYKVELYRKLSADRQVKYIADLSSSLATRRMYNVFPTIASNNGTSFGGEFLAAAAAGLVSSVLPQQPVTNVEINGVDDIPMVYQTLTRAQLNTIAEGGTFIIMQDRPGSKVYVRHQISTAYSENNLLKAELSITKNLDSISYYFAEIFAPLIGKYNITPELLDVIRSKLEAGLLQLETATAAGLYGPQVLAEGTEIKELYQNPVNKDHVYAKVHLNLPVPFNYFDLDLEI